MSSAGRTAARLSGRRILYCFGDSHAEVFRHLQEQRGKSLRHTVLDATVVGGATALGMVNPNSSTNALGTFKRRIERLPSSADLLFLLGEVDCGFLLWHRSENGIEPLESGFDTSFDNYTTFLNRVRERGHPIIVSSVPIPTIKDNRTWGGLDNARGGVTATLRERTDLTVRYNERLRNWCRSANVRMMDVESDALDEETGLVREDFINADPLDHHYDVERFSAVVIRSLRELDFS